MVKATGKKRVRVDEQDVRGGWGVVVWATMDCHIRSTYRLTDNKIFISSELLHSLSRRYCTLYSMVQNFEI